MKNRKFHNPSLELVIVLPCMYNLKKFKFRAQIFFNIITLFLMIIVLNAQAANPGDVVINELMWMGSTGSTADEWIELRNMTNLPIDLTGWNITRLSGGSETLMLEIPSGIILANGYFLISNYDADHSNSRLNVTPDIVDTDVSLPNTQLQIKIYDNISNLIDTADDGIGTPAAGDNTNKYSMMRIDPPGDGSLASNWFTANIASGWDPGATDKGTPGSVNLAGLLDHFVIDNISNQVVGVAFPITVIAKDANETTVSSFTSYVNIVDLTFTISPSTSGNFSAGVWTGDVTITQEIIGDVITVIRAEGNETGTSNSFNVTAGTAPGSVVINELMWMGSTGSTADEWIELRNMTNLPIDLAGWNITSLSAGSETLMFEIPSGIIPANGYFLISNYNADHSNSRLNVIPDIVDTDVSLPNTQLQIKLYDNISNLIDTADDGIGTPAAGDNTNKYSMMRIDPPGDGTLAFNWFTANIASGWDRGAVERGTPGSSNVPATTITVTSPNGGENWIEAGYYNIIWTSTGPVTDVQIEYSLDSGFTWTTIVATTPNDGIYTWTAPQTSSPNCLVRISDAIDGDPSDISNEVFTISEKPTAISLSAFCAIQRGSNVIVEWTTETEPNNIGFNVYRNGEDTCDYIKINDAMFTSKGDATTGASYSYTDQPPETGIFYYKIEAVSVTGQSTFHGPVSVMFITSVSRLDLLLPLDYSLSQNYPNPFNPQTHIRFQLPTEGFVTISIYDIQGQIVRTILNERKSAGTYSVTWDSRDERGNNVTSGVYLYRITSGEFSMTKKMILMK